MRLCTYCMNETDIVQVDDGIGAWSKGAESGFDRDMSRATSCCQASTVIDIDTEFGDVEKIMSLLKKRDLTEDEQLYLDEYAPEIECSII